jgi:hypothetical protein
MIEWFCEQSKRLNTAILLALREGEPNVWKNSNNN